MNNDIIETNIYTTRKLEKLIGKHISDKDFQDNHYLGSWSSTLFYVSRKKCWLIINKLTRYNLIIPNVRQADLKNIDTIFKENLHAQLNYDGIIISLDQVEKLIGAINLRKTNNDRSSNGSLNQALYTLEFWKHQFGSFDEMNFRDLNNRLNSSPNKILNWEFPKDKMNELLNNYL